MANAAISNHDEKCFEPTGCDVMEFQELMVSVEATINAHGTEPNTTWKPIAIMVMNKIVDMYDSAPGIIQYGCDFQEITNLVVLIGDETRPKLSNWLEI